MPNENVRVRFAPSPTGYLHIGGLRTALFNWLFAKKHKGTFILRIEDTDQSRLVEGSVENILEAFKWYGMDYDEGIDKGGDYGPYIQSKRLSVYTKHAQDLIKNDKAYYCFCTSERLSKLRKEQSAQKIPPQYDGFCRDLSKEEALNKVKKGVPHVVRMKLPKDGNISVEDLVRGKVDFSFRNLDDAIILKTDGFPTYQLANVIDDHMMKISQVIRAEEWLPSTPKHVWLYLAFGWDVPKFAHLPLIMSPKGGKLSKRDGAVSAMQYKEMGYLPEAILNFIVLLGWNPKTDQEIFSLTELINAFDLKKVNKAGAVFNLDKLNFINSHYIKNISLEELTKRCVPFYKKEGIDTKNIQYLEKVTALVKDRMTTLDEVGELTRFVFKLAEYDSSVLIPKKSTRDKTKDYLEQSHGLLNGVGENDFNSNKLKELFISYIKDNDIKTNDMLWPLRVALSGQKNSPDVFDIAEVLGKAETITRTNHAINKL
ncbi:glutamate--tRNA ligase [Patescibacteria group bacterium]|nr:glutamate--tRNA ligase [Patescibacteria group bacterium]MBU1890742.1 glutamate--tRNA ligase [Patescibacteria group bacterium]